MKIAIIGGDRRFGMLTDLLAADRAVFRDPAAQDLPDMDAIITQNPVKGAMDMKEILCHMRPDARLILHGSGMNGIPEKIRCTDLLQDEDFVLQNAILTAEGALCAAMQATGGALTGRRCMVVGFGRIGRALTGMLLGIGADVTVAARRQASREAAEEMGAQTCDTAPEALMRNIARADFVFSTPPELLLNEDVLRHVRRGVPVIDLASPPYGVDIEAARRLDAMAWRESGVPGRYCPAAAAKLLRDAVLKLLATD